jgi:hypothetical protein
VAVGVLCCGSERRNVLLKGISNSTSICRATHRTAMDGDSNRNKDEGRGKKQEVKLELAHTSTIVHYLNREEKMKSKAKRKTNKP